MTILLILNHRRELILQGYFEFIYFLD